MSDIELEAHFAPMLQFTRPDRDTAIHKEKRSPIATKSRKMSDIEQMLLGLSPEKRATLERMSKEQGIDLDDLI